ncbi:EamA family transporter RarD [Anianabacter salinae]|uniref:EamA family transporter RarD n=1 Tax=Anianabacter salinae TaxID=2851023 RepID=UPI00225E409B|nr:EamA family transporter RarD [Anianabacter salinae]MBV0911884.1 EamA family transporter RarD [Anianabacter salinae]
MTDAGKGVLAMVGACCVWGLAPIYYKLLAHVPPLELLSHRTLWSLIFFGGVLGVQGRIGLVPKLVLSRQVWAVALAAFFISINWLLFILAVQTERALQASLGYYIYPLVAVLMGVVLFQERLSRGQAVAVGLAAAAVLTLIVGLGAAPWIALALAASFGTYGVVKKRLDVGPVVSVTTEVVILAPLAIFWLWGVHVMGWTGFVGRNLGVFGSDLRDSALLALSGPLTATPLILFSYASRRVAMKTIGLVQYLNPTLQFLVATLIFTETFTLWHGLAFGMIWTALALYSAEAFRQDRASRRPRLHVPHATQATSHKN